MGSEGEISNGGVTGVHEAMSIDEKGGLLDKDEVMIRRMKNRERQRRYRARKRMREEVGIDENLSFDTTGQHEEEELECNGPNDYVENFVPRVYCDRDWKKEARKAHLIVNKVQGGSCESVKRKIRRHQRDWKAEARKKRS